LTVWVRRYDRVMAASDVSLPTSAFAPISGAWFTMGTDRGQEDERPPHRVFVDPFELAVFPVTRGEYARTPPGTSRPAIGTMSHLLNQICLSWASAGSMPWRIARGDPTKIGARSDCRRKLNGNSPRVGGRRHSSRGVTSCPTGF
jgi:hypothetical protein